MHYCIANVTVSFKETYGNYLRCPNVLIFMVCSLKFNGHATYSAHVRYNNLKKNKFI